MDMAVRAMTVLCRMAARSAARRRPSTSARQGMTAFVFMARIMALKPSSASAARCLTCTCNISDVSKKN